MSTSARRRHSLEDYLDVEEKSPCVKHEYIDGEIFAMAGGSVEHAALSMAVGGLLLAHLRGTPCRAYSADLRIRIPSANVSTYADATVICGAVERDPASRTHVVNPAIVVEVASPGTEAYDREEKRLYYQQLPSLREYVVVAQDRRSIEVWHREGSGWRRSIASAGERAALPSIAFSLDVDELYALAGVMV